MTAVDHAELKRLAEGGGGDAWGLNDWRPEGQILVCGGEGHSYGLFATVDDALPDVAAFIAAANPAVVLALLSEIEGLKAERDAYRDAAHLEAVDCDAAEAALRTQAPDSWRPDREAVARKIEPYWFTFTDRGTYNATANIHCDVALAKADAILALRPQTAESGK